MAGGWYFSRAEIENNSPSRKDGIDLKREQQLRFYYCSFIYDLGMKLQVAQLTIATAMMFCHRFYLYQSHAKNDWHTVATVCMFLASKVEDEQVPLDKVTIVAYELMYRRDPTAPQRIRQKNVFEKQRALISTGERLVLTTIRFDLNVEHPHKPLVRALNKFGITQKDVRQVAWNFVNDWLRNILCLQYKPHYIAAGSLFLSAKMHNVKLPSGKGYAWWHEFDVTPQKLNAIVEEMKELLGYKKSNMEAHVVEKPTQTSLVASKEESVSPDSCLSNTPGSSTRSPSGDLNGRSLESISQNLSCGSNPDTRYDSEAARPGTECQAGEASTPESVVDNSEICVRASDSVKSEAEKVVSGPCEVDMDRFLALRKKRKSESQVIESKVARESASADDLNYWIEQELESGVVLAAQSISKRRRLP